MKIVCIGGGPAGLYFALLMKQQNPAHDITVVERNKPYDTFGWGVVFSDATMDNMRQWDPATAEEIEQAFNHWDDIELRFKSRRIRSGGHGFVGIGRKKLLNILQARCEQLDVKLVFETDAASDAHYPDADLIIASDGINSRIRTLHADVFRPDIVTRPNRFIWLGTKKLYDAFTFDFQRTEHGWFQAHIYKFDDQTTTFIVECPEHVWLAHGLDKADQDQSIAFCKKVFADTLQGESLMTNARDAVHTAHFAIGSGTKLAIEDAIELTRQFQLLGDGPEHITEVLTTYQEARRVETLRLQNAAWNAMEWFEVCGERYCDQLEPEQFMYSMLTRRGDHRAQPEGAATDVHALHLAQRHTEKPHRGLADGPVLRRGRRARRLSPGAPGCTRHGRRRSGVCRDDLRERGRPHYPRLSWAVHRRTSPRFRPHRRLDSCPHRCQIWHTDWPRWCQSLNARRLGGR